MSRMGGIEALKHIKNVSPGIPIIIMPAPAITKVARHPYWDISRLTKGMRMPETPMAAVKIPMAMPLLLKNQCVTAVQPGRGNIMLEPIDRKRKAT